MEQVKLYDTTLRDGMGGPGMSLSVEEKLKVVEALDALGVHFIEAGFPSSNPKEAELFERLEERRARQLDDRRVRDDPPPRRRRRGRRGAADDRRVLRAGRLPRRQELGAPPREGDPGLAGGEPGDDRRLGRLLPRAGQAGGVRRRALLRRLPRRRSGYAIECARAAADAGAENVTLCDTNGGNLPEFVGEATAAVVAELGDAVEVGIHTHNDAECAVANSLAAVSAGARLVQGTVNGYGERCGNANLASILPALQLKLGFEVVGDEQLASLTPTAHYLDELCNLTPDADAPYVGRNAFAHKAGMHAAGVAADARTFEHLDPAAVGNDRDVLPSELSGKATIRTQAERAGLEIDDEAAGRAVNRLKEREHRGYHYEAAPASFELLLREEAGSYRPLFELESFRVTTEKRADGRVETEATIRVRVDGERYLRVAEGNGPVNALDRALRGAIVDRYPHLADIELTNYKVRILDESHGTGAITRVLLDSSDGEREWGTIGVSENIIEASWEALVDSLEYAFQE